MLVVYLVAASALRMSVEGARVAFVLLAIAATGHPGFGGAMVAALMVPHVLAAPVIGAYGDRTRRPRLFYGTALWTVATSFAGCALLVGRVPAPLVLLVAALGGCAGPLATGGLTSLLRDLVPAAGRDRAYSLDVATYNIAGIVGPAAVALFTTIAGARVATLATAALAGVGATVVPALPLARRGLAVAAPPSMLSGALLMWRNRTLRAVTLASGLGSVVFGVLPLAAALLAAQWHATAAAGLLVSAFGLGGLAGSLLNARFRLWPDRPQRTVVVGLLAGAVPLALVPLTAGGAGAALLFAASGLTTGPVTSAQFAVRDRCAPAELHTQVFTLGAALKISFGALGAALAAATVMLGGGWLVAMMAGGNVIGAGTGAWLLARSAGPVAAGPAAAARSGPPSSLRG